MIPVSSYKEKDLHIYKEEELPKKRIQLTVQKETGACSSNFPRRHTMYLDEYSTQLKFQK